MQEMTGIKLLERIFFSINVSRATSLISRRYSPNEMVTFVATDSNQGKSGQVIGALDDDNTYI